MPVSKEEFFQLLEKYVKRQCTPQEEFMVNQWYEAIQHTSNEPLELTSELETKLWKVIEGKTKLGHQSNIKYLVTEFRDKEKTWNIKWVGIAASILLVGVLGSYLLMPSGLEKRISTIPLAIERTVNLITTKNTDSKIVKPVRLEDGTLVILQPNSEIEYNHPFEATQRRITLTGEAFFEVTRDVTRPFFVYTQGLVTKVLGTSFNIKANVGDRTIVVDVKTGKVAVYKESNIVNRKEYLLTPNQQAVYNREADEILQQLQEDPQVIITEKEINEMKFYEAPATAVFAALEKAYGVELVYDESVFFNCSLTTRLSNEGLYEKLQIICKALGATYEARETKVFIQGKGCE